MQSEDQLLDTTTMHLLCGTVLAFDFGKKRIGVAIGDSGIRLAHPHVTIESEKTEQRFLTIAKLIEEWQPVLLVVGLPTHADGTEHELTRLSQRFARRLEGRFKIKAVLVDERYTSLTASEMLREMGIRGKKQKPMLDQIAAQQILQSFFDEQTTTTAT
ncbi:MAG: Holliday junction resolvase RuvX [Nitrosomonas sp.]|nr:Holliday junction resolvase RuvX [Nitrosomonas sp.]